MKKMITIIALVIIIIMCITCSCSDIVGNAQEKQTDNMGVEIFVDEATGVNYFLYNRKAYSGGIIMRVNADGTPYVSEVN